MAKFANYEEQASAAAGDYVKAETLFKNGTVFNIIDAVVRDSRFRDDLTGEQKEEVAFTIQYADAAEAEGIAEKQLTMSANNARMWFVKHFSEQGDELEDMELLKLPSTGKGQAPWGFKASAREAFPKNGRK